MKIKHWVSLFYFGIITFSGLTAGENLIKNPTFNEGLKHWHLAGKIVDNTVSKDPGGKSITWKYPKNGKGQICGSQTVELNQKVAKPFIYGCSSKCEGLSTALAPSHRIYGIEICVRFMDGTYKWLRPKKTFSLGTHDWETIDDSYAPPRPIKNVSFYFRINTPGQVWYDEFYLIEQEDAGELKGCKLTKTDSEIIMENDFVKLTFEPAKGGTCSSFIVKNGNRQFSGNQHPSFRMFTDRLRSKGNTFNRVYTYETGKNTENQVEIRMKVTAPEGYPYLVVEKIFRLSKHSSALEVVYNYTNLVESMADLVITPYFRGGWNIQKDPNQHYTVPTYKGIKNYGPRCGDVYVKNMAAPWIAAGNGKGASMVCEFDYSRLDVVYFWGGGQDETCAEWYFMPLAINPGKTFSTSITYYPATGLTHIDGAENGIASSVTDENGNLKLEFVPSASYNLQCQAEITSKDGKTVRISRQLAFIPGKKASVPLNVKTQDVNLVKYTLADGNTVVFEAERSFAQDYVYKPRSKKVKPAEIVPFTLELSSQFVTPHINYARPFVNGKTRALILVDLFHMREIIELAQRMDLDYRTVRFSLSPNMSNWGMCDRFGSFTVEDSNLSLSAELKKPLDLIVVSDALWSQISADNQKAIAEKLRSGIGIVTLSPSGLKPALIPVIGGSQAAEKNVSASDHYITKNLPLELIPASGKKQQLTYFAPWMKKLSSFVYAGENGKYRSVIFTYWPHGGLTPVTYGIKGIDHAYQDYALSLLARAFVWAAGKEPAVTLDNLKVSNGKLSFRLKGAENIPAGSVRVMLYHPMTNIRKEKTFPLEGKEFSVPVLDSSLYGKNIYDVAVSGKKGVIDWGTCTFTHAAPAALTKLVLKQSIAKKGETITGRAEYRGKKGCRIRLELTDGHGRLLSAQEKNASEADIELKITEETTGIVFVTAKLFDGDRLADRKTVSCLVPHKRELESTLPFTVCDMGHRFHARRYLDPVRFQRYRDAGANETRYWDNWLTPYYKEYLAYDFPTDYPVASLTIPRNIFQKNFSDPYAKTKDKHYLHRNPCFHNPEHVAAFRKNIAKKVRTLVKFSPASFDCGDEVSLTLWGSAFDFCFSDHTLKAFREWLKTRYGSLADLNREWRTSFNSWDEVTPSTTEEIKKLASASRTYASWADHRRFMEITFCGAAKIVKDVIRECGADIPLDMSGTQQPNAYSGMDMWLLSKYIDIAAAYTSNHLVDIIGSFGRPLVKPWHGYGNDGPGVKFRVWKEAFSLKNYGISYYHTYNFLHPDYTLPRQVRELLEYTQDLRDGGARLLRELYEQPEVLIHYSHSSIHAAVIEGRYPEFLAARNLWCQLLYDMHIPFRFVAYEEIENGELDRNPAKILILPESTAISSQEAEAIQRFVRNGGLLIGDRMTAIMNEHCTLQKRGLLDDVFGLDVMDTKLCGNLDVSVNGQKITISAGSAQGKNPLLSGKAGFLNAYGKGKALYLNFLWSQYTSMRLLADKISTANAFKQFMMDQMAPFRTRIGVSVQVGNPDYVRTFIYYQGKKPENDARFIGIVRDVNAIGSSSDVKIKLDKPYYVYDLRKKVCLGNKRTGFSANVASADAVFYAILPYRIKNVFVTAPQLVKGGDDVKLSLGVSADHDSALCGHVFKVRVFDPDGKAVPLYSKNLYGKAGKAEYGFKTALNDKAGNWKILITDFISGKSASAVVRLVK